MGDTGGKVTNTGQPFAAHQLPAAVGNLPVEVAVKGLQPLHHGIESHGEVLHFVAAFNFEPVVEISSRNAPDAFLQVANWIENP